MNSLFTEENSLIEKLHNQVMRHTILEEERADQLKRMAALKKEMESTDRKFRQNELSRKSFLNRLTVLVRQRESANETEKKEKEKEEIGSAKCGEALNIEEISILIDADLANPKLSDYREIDSWLNKIE